MYRQETFRTVFGVKIVVTAVVNVANVIGAQAGNSANGVAGQAGVAGGGNNAGQDESAFAQLLGGMDEVTPAAAPTTATTTTTKKAANDVDAVGGALSDEMLAMLAIPVTPIESVATPAVTSQQATTDVTANTVAIVADTAMTRGNTVAVGTATNATTIVDAATTDKVPASKSQGNAAQSTIQDKALVSDAATNTDTKAAGASDASSSKTIDTNNSATAPSVEDLRWLRSNPQAVAQSGAQAGSQAGVKDIKTVKIAAIAANAAMSSDATAATQVTSAANPRQEAYQQLLTQTAPMVAAASGDRERDNDKVDATSAVNVTPIGNVATQAIGTQLANDAQATENATRHQLHSAVGSHQWATELGNKLTMLATKDTQSATLHMSPADLGPVQVRIDMNQNQASVWFTAEHAETRSALEQSLPRLREMFTQQGMSLTDAGVFGDRQRQQASYSNPEQNSSFSAPRVGSEEMSEGLSSVRGISLSLLDAYA